jgi:predicted DNA-binding transcriptional regulator AlpA
MSVQNQQIADAPVPKANRSVPCPDPCSEPLFDVPQAAKYLGLSAKWVYRNYRRLTPILIGDGDKPRIRFRRCDLDAWVRKHRIQ